MQSSDNTTRLGTMVLNMWDVYDDKNWYWIGIGGLLGFVVVFNGLFTLALTYLDRKFFSIFVFDSFFYCHHQLRKILTHHNNSPWEATSFASKRRRG